MQEKSEHTMYAKFESLLKERNTTTYKVAKETGISNSMFSLWKSGRSEPRLVTLQAIAEYFNVPTAYFYEDKDYSLGITEEQAKSLGINTEVVKQQLNAQLLDERAITLAKQIQKLDKTQQIAIEAIVNGLLHGKTKA